MQETDQVQRRAIIVELAIVGTLTFGFFALSAALDLIEAELHDGIAQTTIALNPARSSIVWIDVVRQVMSSVQKLGMAALGVYLLWRSGIGPRLLGLAKPRLVDIPPGLGLAALIGIPGLALVAAANVLGVSGNIQPAESDSAWWRLVLLCLSAFANAASEEVLVVGYLLTRLRQLGVRDGGALASSAILRGAYHLYQGLGGGFGNIVMGLVFGRWYQKTNRLWPLIAAHTVMDIVAFVGYALLTDHLSWLGL